MPAAAITFFISLVLLAGFVVYRVREEKRGVKLWAHSRERADEVIAEAYERAVKGNLPSNWRDTFMTFMHQASHAAVVLTVQGLRAAERPLLRLSHRMRRGGMPTGNGKAPSDFLKTITPEKKTDNGATPESGV